ncbi:helix-turn-helix domain-containing protein [Thioalkalivibrio sp. ALJT]|uniref:helix-turn-helix domain-containing protein n=1 Tax=Thioalkalivibrio sp. ALJT TaxID=1158146 RepID=UPI0003659FCF|nr:helix-turn-helix domain-containing protein [Thioalkalivibrio sp. ALJT]
MTDPRDKEPGLGRVDAVDDSVGSMDPLRAGAADPDPDPGPALSAATGLTSRDQPPQYVVDQSDEEPGAGLRRAREAAGLDTATMARRIHLGRGILEDLEANRFQHMPPAYVRGYLRSCANELGVDAGPWIAAFEQHGMMDPELRAVATPSGRGRQRRLGRGIYGPAILLALVLLGLGVYAWTERSDRADLPALSEDDATPAAPHTEPGREDAAVAAVPDVDEAEGPEAVAEPAVEQPEVPARQEEEAVGADAVPEDPVVTPEALAEPVTPRPQPEAAEPAGVAPEPLEAPSPALASVPAQTDPEAALVLEISETSWVEVRDAADAVILTGVLSPGDREELRVELPARVVLGNAAGVSLSVDGEDFDFAQHIRGDRTARFDLEP